MVDHKIVTAESGDINALVRLCSELLVEDSGTRDPFTDVDWPKAHARNHFLSLISRDDALCLLAKSGRTTVGYLAGYVGKPAEIRPVTIAELQSMYVEPGSGGNGVGSALVDGFLDWARDRRAGRVSVTAYASNEAAVRFYGRIGLRLRSVTLEMAP